MASGIGAGAHLHELGIPLVHDLPGVGQNLQDHLDIILCKAIHSTDLYGKSLSGYARMAFELLRYGVQRKGMVSSNIAEAGGFVKSRPDLTTPDLQLHFTPVLARPQSADRNDYGHGYSCHVCVLRPQSRGEVRLASTDMRDAPLIDPRFLSAPSDLDGMIAGVKIMRRIFKQAALASYGGQEWYSEEFGEHDSNDAAIESFMRRFADTVYHAVGTCRMGSDSAAVVDPALRVRGVEGLRVADASIMPTLVAGNTNAPSIMIGEKAADLVRAAR